MKPFSVLFKCTFETKLAWGVTGMTIEHNVVIYKVHRRHDGMEADAVSQV